MSGLARFFLAPQPLHGLVAARVLLGLAIFGAYATRAPVVQEFFGPRGLAGHDFYARNPGAPPLDPSTFVWLQGLRELPSESVVWGLWALLLAASLSFALGAFTRLTGPLTLVLHLLFWARNPWVFWDWGRFVNGPLLYAVLAPTGRHLSVDAWRRRRAGHPEASWLATGWPLRLMQIHVAAMYLAAGASRLDKESWFLGEMIFVALSGATHSRLAIDWSALAPLLALGTWFAFVVELLAPWLLWVPRLGRWWALALIAIHVSLELLTNVGYWNFVMSAGLLCFVLPWPRSGTRGPAP